MRLTGRRVALASCCWPRCSAAALTARLGVWQLDRAAQKTALQAALDARGALPPLPRGRTGARPPRRPRRSSTARVALAGRWLADAHASTSTTGR